jgi:hypothetical protein
MLHSLPSLSIRVINSKAHQVKIWSMQESRDIAPIKTLNSRINVLITHLFNNSHTILMAKQLKLRINLNMRQLPFNNKNKALTMNGNKIKVSKLKINAINNYKTHQLINRIILNKTTEIRKSQIPKQVDLGPATLFAPNVK